MLNHRLKKIREHPAGYIYIYIYIYIYMLKKRKNYTQANHTQTIVNKRQSLEGIHREKYEKQCNVENYKQTKLDFKS